MWSNTPVDISASDTEPTSVAQPDRHSAAELQEALVLRLPRKCSMSRPYHGQCECASQCIAPDEVAAALTEIELARHAQNDAASDTMVSDEEIEPHLAAVDRISVTNSEYHDCLPDTAEEALR